MSNQQSHQFTFRCPPKIAAYILERVADSGDQKSEVIVDLLEVGFQALTKMEGVNDGIDLRIQQALAPLQNQINDLRLQITNG